MMRAITMAVLVCGGLGQAAAADVITLRYGQIPSTIRSVSSLPLYVARQQGLFAREGIALDLVPIEGGTDNMVAALDRSTVDVTQTATPYLVSAALAGSDAAAIAGGTANPIYSLIVQPRIQSFADLKGRVLGLSLPIDTISISTRKLLALKGLSEGDYFVKALVGTPLRFDCLKRGECDGVPLGQPDDFLALAQGFRRLGLSTEAVGSFQFEVAAARRVWAAANRDAVVRFVRALGAAYRFIRDGANRAEVIKATVALTGAQEDVAQQTLALYFEPERGVMPKQAEINLAGLAQVIAFMGEGETIKLPLPAPERFVDLQYLQAAGVE